MAELVELGFSSLPEAVGSAPGKVTAVKSAVTKANLVMSACYCLHCCDHRELVKYQLIDPMMPSANDLGSLRHEGIAPRLRALLPSPQSPCAGKTARHSQQQRCNCLCLGFYCYYYPRYICGCLCCR